MEYILNVPVCVIYCKVSLKYKMHLLSFSQLYQEGKIKSACSITTKTHGHIKTILHITFFIYMHYSGCIGSCDLK